MYKGLKMKSEYKEKSKLSYMYFAIRHKSQETQEFFCQNDFNYNAYSSRNALQTVHFRVR